MFTTCRNPFVVEHIVFFKPLRFVPIAFIHTDLFTTLDRNSPIGKKIWRIRKNHIELKIKLTKYINAIALNKGKI